MSRNANAASNLDVAVGIRQKRWIDITGLNLIRVVVGSYFMAIALGLITGVDPRALFVSWTDPQTADLLGTIILFAATFTFMAGVFLRMTSLVLAIFVFASSMVQHLILVDVVNIADFWRDLTLVCAVLLSYSCIKRSEERKAVLVWRRKTPKTAQAGMIAPRRIRAEGAKTTRKAETPSSYNASLRPLLEAVPADAPVANIPLHATRSTPMRGQKSRPDLEHDADIENIFSAL